MPIKKLEPYKPKRGDDMGIIYPRYSQVPQEYGFQSIQPRSACPLTIQIWDELIDFAERYYYKFEIVGSTWVDFQSNLQLMYDKNSDTFERLMEVYYDDVAKPVLGRTEKRTYDTMYETEQEDTSTGASDTTVTNDLQTTVATEGQTTNIDVPVNATNPNTQTPSSISRDTNDDTTQNTGTVTTDYDATDNRQSKGTQKHTGTEIIELSDLGVRPNYETLNGFLDNNRTYYDVFVWMFQDCFSINDYLVW